MTLSLPNPVWSLRPRHWVMICASGVFILGALIYPLRTVIGLTDNVFIGNFSAFSHALFFVLAWAYPYRSAKSLAIGAMLVATIVTGFELLQKPAFLASVERYLPDAVINYAKHGIYDPLDIAAGFLGVAMAGVIVLLLVGKRDI